MRFRALAMGAINIKGLSRHLTAHIVINSPFMFLIVSFHLTQNQKSTIYCKQWRIISYNKAILLAAINNTLFNHYFFCNALYHSAFLPFLLTNKTLKPFRGIKREKTQKYRAYYAVYRHICAVFLWSEWGGSNSRPLRPERSTLPTALHPETYEFTLLPYI